VTPVVAIHIPANTATRPTIRFGVIGSPKRRLEQAGCERIDGHGTGDPIERWAS